MGWQEVAEDPERQALRGWEGEGEVREQIIDWSRKLSLFVHIMSPAALQLLLPHALLQIPTDDGNTKQKDS